MAPFTKQRCRWQRPSERPSAKPVRGTGTWRKIAGESAGLAWQNSRALKLPPSQHVGNLDDTSTEVVAVEDLHKAEEELQVEQEEGVAFEPFNMKVRRRRLCNRGDKL